MTAITAALSGDLKAFMAAEAAAVVRGVRDAVRGQVAETQAEARRLVDAGLPGKGRSRPSNAIRSRLYEGGQDPAGIVYSKFGRREGGQYVDYLLPHIQGATMRPRAGGAPDLGRYMVLPVKGVSRRLAAVDRSLARLDTDPQLALIPLPGGRFLFVRRPRETKRGGYRMNARTTLIAMLVRRVDLPKRINLTGLDDRAATSLARRVLAGLEG
jgi:hypothetical protein